MDQLSRMYRHLFLASTKLAAALAESPSMYVRREVDKAQDHVTHIMLTLEREYGVDPPSALHGLDPIDDPATFIKE